MKAKDKKAFIVLGVIIFLLVGVVIFLLVGENGAEILPNGNGENAVEPTPSPPAPEKIQDAEGISYGTVKIGNQVWMSENLQTTPEYGQSWCYSDHDFNCDRYGRLYNWEAVMAGSQEPGSQGICPDGWYVPTDEDWHILESFFAISSCEAGRLNWGCYPAGGMMKTEVWGGVEESTFAVLPAGRIDREGRSGHLHTYSFFWTSSKIGDGVWRRVFLDVQSSILRTTENPEYGYSVRCIKR